MDTFSNLSQEEPQPDDDATERVEVVTLTRLPDACITVTLMAPGGIVHNVMKGSYVYRVMLANGYKVVQS
jgi:hypothetical protein